MIRFDADLLRFAASHGYKPRACWMEDPESKGKVENRRKVGLHIYESRLQVLWEGAVVVTLPRLRGKGRRLLQKEHYQQRIQGPGSRGDSLQRRFEAIGPAAPAYLAGLARTRQGHLREQAEGIVGLCQVYGQTAIHAAMERAASFGAYSYGTIKRILEKQERGAGVLPERPTPGLPVTVGIPKVAVQERSLSYYAEVAGQRR